ncbi:Tctex1 domain-containing protein 2, partial [Perkinsus olseni]
AARCVIVIHIIATVIITVGVIAMSNPPTTTTHPHTSKHHNTLNTASSIEVNDNTATTSKFRPPMIRDVMRNIIKERIDSAVDKYPHYDPDVYAALSEAISNDIKDRIADLNIPRYKILVEVIIAEYNGQGIRVSSKCLWDNNTDNLATHTYITDTIMCVGVVYGTCVY